MLTVSGPILAVAVPCPVCLQAADAEMMTLAVQVVAFFGTYGFLRCPYCCLEVEHPDDEYVKRATDYVEQMRQRLEEENAQKS